MHKPGRSRAWAPRSRGFLDRGERRRRGAGARAHAEQHAGTARATDSGLARCLTLQALHVGRSLAHFDAVGVVSEAPKPPVPVRERAEIAAAVMSFDTMIGYCGDVEACNMNDSLNRECGMALRPSRMCRNEAWESAASSLCVEWVANTVGPVWSFGSPCIAWRSR